MGLFNIFGEQEHNTFDYKPVYYDREKEERRQRFGKVDGTAEPAGDGDSYVPGSYLKGSFRDGRYRKSKKTANKVQNIIGLIGLILIFIVLYFIAKFYTIL